MLGVMVLPAQMQDRDGAKLLFDSVRETMPNLLVIYADGGYAGQLVLMTALLFGWLLRVVPRNTQQNGFTVLRRRWIVERTFAWLGKYRRLYKDCERLRQSSEGFIRIAMINLMLHRLAVGS